MEFRKEDLMKALTKQKAQLDQERSENSKVKEAMDARIRALEEELRASKEEAAHFTELAFKLDQIEQEREVLLHKLSEEESGRKVFQVEFDEERRRLEAELQLLREKPDSAAAALEQSVLVEQLADQVKSLETLLDQNQQDLNVEKLVHADLRLRNEAVQSELAQVYANYDSLNTRYESIEAEVTAKKESHLSEMASKDRELLAEREKSAQELQLRTAGEEQLELLKAERDSLQNVITTLNDRVAGAETRCAAYERQVKELEVQITDRKLADYDLSRTVSSLERQLTELNAEMERNQAELLIERSRGDEQRAELERLRDNVSVEKASVAEEDIELIASLKGTIENLESQLRSLQSDILVQEQERISAVRESERRIEELQTQLLVANEALQATQGTEDSVRRELASVQSRLLEQAEVFERMKQDVVSKEEKVTGLERTCEELASALRISEEKTEVRADEQQTVDPHLRERLEVEIQSTARLQTEIEQLTHKLGEEVSSKRRLETKLDEMIRTLKRVEDESTTAKRELNASSSRFESMLAGQPGPWVQQAEDDEMPVPTHVTLDSPVIQTILQAWTQDQKNLQFFNKWCAYVLNGGDVGPAAQFQKGVELSKCTSSVKDGLLSMLVPMLRAREDISVSVFTRERVQVFHDVRLRVTKSEQ